MAAHILLVEDSALVRSALQLLLEENGFRVTLAATGAEAIDELSETTPDLMLLDLGLPDGDGLMVLDALLERGLRMPVTVALTGSDDSRTVARCLERGCREVLVKPVPTRELVARVVSHCGR